MDHENKRIAELLTETGVSKLRLATVTGVSRQTVRSVASGASAPEIETLYLISRALGYNMVVEVEDQDGNVTRHWPKSIPLVLKAMRLRAGLSQVEVAKASGIGQTLISCYENGTHTPRFPQMRKIAHACGHDIRAEFYN